MPFWIFKKKEQAEEQENIVIPARDKREKLEEDVQFLVDYFHEIARQLSKIEHNAAASELEVGQISKHALDFRKQAQKLQKSEPALLGYWNAFLNICDDYVYNVKQVLPKSAFSLPLSQKKIEQLGRASRRSTSEFVGLLNDIKKKLGKQYKRDFKVNWPERSVF